MLVAMTATANCSYMRQSEWTAKAKDADRKDNKAVPQCTQKIFPTLYFQRILLNIFMLLHFHMDEIIRL